MPLVNNNACSRGLGVESKRETFKICLVFQKKKNGYLARDNEKFQNIFLLKFTIIHIRPPESFTSLQEGNTECESNFYFLFMNLTHCLLG